MYCETPMVHHVRRFVHGSGCVQIVLKELDSPVPGYQHTILNYSWCRICKQVFGSDEMAVCFSRAVNVSYTLPQTNLETFAVFCGVRSSTGYRLLRSSPCPMIHGPCPLLNIWSCVSTAISTLAVPTPSHADTPSTRTTTSTSPTTRWWPLSGEHHIYLFIYLLPGSLLQKWFSF